MNESIVTYKLVIFPKGKTVEEESVKLQIARYGGAHPKSGLCGKRISIELPH
jgi:hypothetical protein